MTTARPQKTMSPVSKLIGGKVFPWAMVLMGLVALAVGASDLLRGWQSRGWPTVSGVVTASHVEVQTGSRSTSNSSRSSSSYIPSIRYRYEVEGEAYEGDRHGFTTIGTGDEDRARAIVDHYPEGATVTVHYDPRAPSRAVLEPGVGWGGCVFPALGIVFVLLGSGAVWLFPKLLVDR